MYCYQLIQVIITKYKQRNSIYRKREQEWRISLRYRNRQQFENEVSRYEEYNKKYGWEIYGLHGSEYEPGEFSFIEYENTKLVKHFTDSYYYYEVGTYYGEGKPLEDIKDNYRELLWDLVIETIVRLKDDVSQIGVDTTDSFIDKMNTPYLNDIRKRENLFMSQLQVPPKIKSWIENKPYTVDDIGMSGNQVLIFEDMVLKVEEKSASVDQQVQMMQWLEGKIPVPKVIAYEVEKEKCYLLMSRISGVMSCETYYLEHPLELLEALASGLKMLWEVDVQDCPYIRDVDTVLKEARIRVDNDLVDVEDAEPTTFGEGGFQSPKHLLEWLENHRPPFEQVLSHGDFCLPNVFLENGQVSGFIDLTKTGVGDKWNDITLCYRSLKHNFDGTYGEKVYKDFNPDMLFEKLGIEPEWEKIKWYLLLDELF